MPVFIRPSRVIIEEGGSGMAVVVIAGGALALGALAAVLDDIIIALAVAAVLAVAGSLAVLAWVLRRERGTVSTPGSIPPGRPPAIATVPPAAIEPRRVLPGVVISERGTGHLNRAGNPSSVAARHRPTTRGEHMKDNAASGRPA